ncbi:hypothetical protein DFJ73DRAFT_796680 [Zopfochytrium polystomum]|nr:hypothetical protein DFJ73DRAFT_796680 [Zopfochytrium polystomum]
MKRRFGDGDDDEPHHRPDDSMTLDNGSAPAVETTAHDGDDDNLLLPIEVGVIGALGDMGKVYVNKWAADAASPTPAVAHIHVCDHPSKLAQLRAHYAPLIAAGLVTAHADGHGVSRLADLTMYTVESAHVASCIRDYARSTKRNGTVAGQTSTKAQEIRAFEEHAPADVSIISLHSMHGPAVDTPGQPLAIIPHRVVRPRDLARVHAVVACFRSRVLELAVDQHDSITADTQAVTHVAFLSMGTAWASVGVYPWTSAVYHGSTVEEVKVMITMRIYFAKWHVYAGVSILNESARAQVQQYARSARELFELMIQEREMEFRDRVYAAAEAVFGRFKEPLLTADTLRGRGPQTTPSSSSSSASDTASNPPVKTSNSHLSILAIVDCWYQSGINPFHHLAQLGTPPFRLWLGISQHVFITPNLLEESIKTALYDKTIRMDDLNFVLAVAQWSELISVGSFDAYRERFEAVRGFFEGMHEGSLEWRRRSDELIRTASTSTLAAGGSGVATIAAIIAEVTIVVPATVSTRAVYSLLVFPDVPVDLHASSFQSAISCHIIEEVLWVRV